MAGATLKRGFFRTVSWTPFCQLWKIHGPSDTGMELWNAVFMLRPRMMCAGYTPPETSDSQSAYRVLNVTVADLPFAFTDLMSSQPVREMTLFAGLMKTFHVATKSAAVTGLPSLHTASGRNVNFTVRGDRFTIVGLPVNSRGTKSPAAFRIWPP